MKKFTFKRINLVMPFILMVLLSSVTFGQMKKPTAPSITIAFRVDMTYEENFNPFTDSLDVPGTMNGWAGSPRMTSIGSSLIYEYVYTVDSGSIQQYKFRINGNWTTSEFPNGGPNRMYLVPNHADTVTSIYNDYQPGTVPMTFKCNMGYQMKTGKFDKTKDYLDVAGNFNNWGAYDVLFDRGNDSIYVIKLNLDTVFFNNQPPVEFKFRINGDWATSEFPDGGANRIARLEDTINGHQNIVDVWYNDEDPTIPAPPVAYNVELQGNLTVGETLTGSYSYQDINGDPEGTSHYNWYRADSITQPEPEMINGVMAINYVLTADDLHKFIAFQVTPVSATGNPPDGAPVRVWSTTFISGVGIDEPDHHLIRFYPNPVSDVLNIENPGNIKEIDIYSVIGEQMLSLPVTAKGNITLNTSAFHPGVYFIRIHQDKSGISTLKFLKK